MEKFKHFTIEEFDCQATGNNKMNPKFIHRLDHLRDACGFPFTITSGYRDPEGHPIEKAKQTPGTHAQGIAADIAVSGGRQRMQIVQHATALGFTGVGVAKGFVHVDIRDAAPVLWCY